MRGAVTLLICASAFVLTNASTQCVENEINDNLLPHKRCNRFYQCVAGELVAQKCAADLRFNIETQLCDWPENVQCGDRDDNESEEIQEDEPENGNVNDDPSQAPIICAAEGSDGILVAHEDCNKFYICSGGIRVTMRCPDNLLYNPFKEQCDWPENVKCRDRLPEGGTENEDDNPGNYDPSLAPEICAAEGSDSVLVAHEYCTKFYICYNGLTITVQCPPNLFFNPRKNQCDWPSNVNCGNRIIPSSNDDTVDNNDVSNSESNNNGEGNSNPSEAPAICAAPGSNGVLVAHEHCNRFYKCANGIPVALDCQLNLLYNPKNERCDWPENVECGDRTISDDDNDSDSGSNENNSEGNNDPSEAPAICAAEGSDGVLVAHENCNQFYKCSRGVPVALECQLNLLYNPRNEQCDWPENVDCGDRAK